MNGFLENCGKNVMEIRCHVCRRGVGLPHKRLISNLYQFVVFSDCKDLLFEKILQLFEHVFVLLFGLVQRNPDFCENLV